MQPIALKDPAGFANEFLRLTLLQGFQSLTKRDLELLIFVLLERDGAIQRFEFCAELAWKAAQDYMQAQGYLDVHSPKAVMRKAYAEHIITDEAGWLALLDARNQTSHLYDDEVASAVYQAIEGTYLPLLRALSEKLSAAV